MEARFDGNSPEKWKGRRGEEHDGEGRSTMERGRIRWRGKAPESGGREERRRCKGVDVRGKRRYEIRVGECQNEGRMKGGEEHKRINFNYCNI